LRVKNAKEANNKLVEVSDDLDDFTGPIQKKMRSLWKNKPLPSLVKSIAAKKISS
jgi:hypothetical protein